MLYRGGVRIVSVAALAVLVAMACSDHSPDEATAMVRDALQCTPPANAVTATSGNVYVNSASLIDSYDSSQGGYGGSNVGGNRITSGS